jgi:hypothetical protein
VRGRKEINPSPSGKKQREQTMDINQLSSKIIGAAIEVHKALGPGLLESACEKIEPIHKAQLLTYLKLSGLKLGLLLNFNMPVMRDGIVRVVNNL